MHYKYILYVAVVTEGFQPSLPLLYHVIEHHFSGKHTDEFFYIVEYT